MPEFTPQVQNFETYGTFNYMFDEVGNVILTPSASIYQHFYVSIPLVNVNYNDNKINSFYNATFTEFVSSTSNSTSSVSVDITDQLNSTLAQNQVLQTRLNSFITQSISDSSSANTQLVKNIIINLRIQLGQGSLESDFNTNFPYFPISLENKINAPTP